RFVTGWFVASTTVTGTRTISTFTSTGLGRLKRAGCGPGGAELFSTLLRGALGAMWTGSEDWENDCGTNPAATEKHSNRWRRRWPGSIRIPTSTTSGGNRIAQWP